MKRLTAILILVGLAFASAPVFAEDENNNRKGKSERKGKGKGGKGKGGKGRPDNAPKVGDLAPKVSAVTVKDGEAVDLSKPEKITVLVFGSHT